MLMLASGHPARGVGAAGTLWGTGGAAGNPATGEVPGGGPFAALLHRGEALAARGRHAAALEAFQAARRAAPTTDDQGRAWFRIANEHARVGAFEAALDAYARQLALPGQPDPVVLGNSAELSMALGRLDDAIRLYHEALEIEERARDRRAHLTTLALGYLGLATALDRSDRVEASAEAVNRALSLDPGLGVLRLAQQGGGDVYVLPSEDVWVYLALARVAQGRADDAADAFRAYLDAVARTRGANAVTARYAARAREHLAALSADRTEVMPRPVAEARGMRVVREVTLSAEGPLPAPLIDAAWRLQPRLLDACLADVPLVEVAVPPRRPAESARAPFPRAPVEARLRLDVTFDGTGRVQAATVDTAVRLPAEAVPCITAALRERLRPPRPARQKPTRAHIEVVLAPVEPSGL